MITFQSAWEYINGIPKFVKKNTMQDTVSFYEKLGSPGKGAKVIHVAGTNGKGSVCAYLQSVLTEAGYRVGMFTSPHLVDIRERIRIDRELISEDDFRRMFAQVEKFIDGEERAYHPSYFEYLYFMAMLYFEEKKPDFVLLETGLGGRLDATNSYPSPVISIITEIGMDHMEYLGDTVEKIAEEKAGIVKKGVPLVYCAKKKTVSEIMEKFAKKAGCEAFPVRASEISLQKCNEKGIDFSYDCGYYEYSMFHLPKIALYQQENAALCIKALSVLQEKGEVKCTEEILRRGLEKAVWEGRMEEILPGFYVDGAHNADGMRAFIESVKKQAEVSVKGSGRILLYSALSDKLYEEAVEEILGAGLFEEIIVAKLQDKRAADVEKIAELFGKEKVTVFRNVEEAFSFCLKKREEGYTVYAAGSLYLAGQIIGLIRRRKTELKG